MKKATGRAHLKPLRVVVFQDGEWLCAQCVDVDLVAQARTLRGLYRVFQRLVVAHVAVRRRYNKAPCRDLPPAPAKYREMFEKSKLPLPTQIIREVRAEGIVVPPPRVRLAAPPAA